MLVSVINLTQAARSAAIAAQAAYEANDSPTTEAQDATTAATDEQGIVKFKCPTADGTTCVTVTNSPGTNYTLQELTTVKIFESVDPYIPIVPSITVSGTATAQSETG